jgi:hypothetical protein
LIGVDATRSYLLGPNRPRHAGTSIFGRQIVRYSRDRARLDDCGAS